MELGTGAPSVQGDVIDFSSISNGVLKGINIVLGITERGVAGVPQLCRSEMDFRRYFGGLVSSSRFPYLMLRALKRGGRFYIIPVGHFTDVEDNTSLEGTKASGSLTVSGSTVEMEASSVGPWANANLVVTITAAASGGANLVDIKIELAGYPELTQVISDFSNTPTSDEKANFNRLSKLCSITDVTTAIPVGTVNFADGAKDDSDIVDDDYIGSANAATGLFAADSIHGAVRIAIPELASQAVDKALADYVDARKDLIALVRTPIGIDADTAIDYREAQGDYDGTPVNSWRTIMWTGGLKTQDSNKNEVQHSELADVLVNYSLKDASKSQNYSPSGLQRGIISDAIGVVKNFGAASQSTEYGKIYSRGINAVIEDFDPELGKIVRLDGNRTLWKKSQLVQKANIAEYLVWLYNMIQPLVKKQQYDPNDPFMWSKLFNTIKPILETSKSQSMRAIYDYKYIGDQFVQKAEDAVYNTAEDIANGVYKFRVLVKPTPAAEWIGFEIGVSSVGVKFEDIIE